MLLGVALGFVPFLQPEAAEAQKNRQPRRFGRNESDLEAEARQGRQSF